MPQNTHALDSLPPRSQWARFLHAANVIECLALAESFNKQFQVEDIQRPESGLALLRNRDGARGEDYFLGEIPVARAHIRLFLNGEAMAEGGAQILDDRTPLARAIAILDAVLANRLPGHEQVTQLLNQGQQHIEQQQAQRQVLLSSTLVDFSLLGNDEDDHND
ncbi:MAG: phosphonate C-P lyase system protein PhnG [Marinobacter sp.]|nr:phosphonate C-P lyase system protein PhnG [Marinobacter sp.]